MICEHCKQRKATVTVTQIINGHKSEKHYCEVCAAQFHPFNLDFHKEEQIPIHQLLSNWFGMPIWKNETQERAVQPSIQTNACPACGFTFRKFLNEGKLGCPQCYETFGEKLPQVLAKIQAGTKHTGKRPGQKVDNNRIIKKQIEHAREQLQLAIQDERFEDAAKFRDEIKALERKLEMGGVDTP
ncbi:MULTISPECIES: UvrB/UvrC motif-containing protein [Ureibacillus]|jgi:protein arginine kinase activator|uniref:Protein arginine kinase activator n=1 Tax=Ureibacillus thermosphaericus TaxID=51173 RepID=A0A840PXF9_URETH|nr:UvrB/UvrC motif-containing protein [Ureibacillus thermosphaericus]MBB5148888.1 protein arginine kinase activator [Ureibacillus thermosphaericus]NKZ31663.1 nucleotide excision repair protein [Ureibacillus thermosphaericus]